MTWAGVLQAVHAAALAHQWWVVFVLVIVGAVALLGHVLGPQLPWFRTDAGKIMLTFATSFAAGIGSAIVSGAPLDWALASASASLAFKAMGGFIMLTKVAIPLVRQRNPALADVLLRALKAVAPSAPISNPSPSTEAS